MRIVHLLLAFCLLLSSCSGDGRDFLDDRAGLLDQRSRERITAFHRSLLADFNIHCKVVVLDRQSSDINRDAAEIFGDLGRKTGAARGLLVLIDPTGKQVRIEVGYDLEDIFPDIFIGYLEREQMLPFFGQNRIGPGIEATEELLVARVQRFMTGQAFDPVTEFGKTSRFSGGGGARSQVAIGAETSDKAAAVAPDAWRPGKTPEESLTVYKRLLEQKIKDPGLALYTPATRQFLARWVVTNAQQDNELRILEKAKIDRVVISGNRAVIRFPIQERMLPPYFLERTDDGWAFDFSLMSAYIQMNTRNMWHFVKLDHPYMFAFADWQFDHNGYPQTAR
jgi:hypothetical protein